MWEKQRWHKADGGRFRGDSGEEKVGGDKVGGELGRRFWEFLKE